MNDTQLLPDDLSACQRLVVEQARAVLEQSDEITKLKQVVEEQQLTINKLLQQAYRNRSERYREDPQQMQIDFGNTPEAGDAADGLTEAVQEAEIVIAEHSRRRHKPRKPRNESLPAHLPRYEVTLEAPGSQALCGAWRAEVDRLRRPGNAGVRAAQAQGPRDADSQVRLRRPGRMRREGSPAAGGPD